MFSFTPTFPRARTGAGEWLVEKHGTSRRRSWRKLHIGVDADTGSSRRR
jgi:hypothetical protein